MEYDDATQAAYARYVIANFERIGRDWQPISIYEFVGSDEAEIYTRPTD